MSPSHLQKTRFGGGEEKEKGESSEGKRTYVPLTGAHYQQIHRAGGEKKKKQTKKKKKKQKKKKKKKNID